jgi:alpha-galactosidase
MNKIYSSYNLGDLLAEYILDTETEIIGFSILPAGMTNKIPEHRDDLSLVPENHFFKAWGDFPSAWEVEPLVLVSCIGSDRAGGFSQGQTMRNGSTARTLHFREQEVIRENGITLVKTTMLSSDNLRVHHFLEYREGTDYLTCSAEFLNGSDHDVTLELFSSFTMGFISPLQRDDAPEKYRIHRFRSSWSSEGRHVCSTAEELQLESSWCHHSVSCERFGQIGSLPVRRWFPFVGIEDTENKILWAARMEAPGSWQMEIYRKDDFFHLSGGQADRESGHWSKTISPGSSFHSGKAWISAVTGGIDDISAVLTDSFHREEKFPDGIPAVFNEWCTSWGNPSADKLSPLLKKVKALNLKYFVIDAGWYADSGGNWEATQGDWEVSSELFPAGLKAFCSEIRENNLIPGLWFEPEVVGENAILRKNTDWLLHLDGKPIKSGTRYFLDFRKKEVRDYLEFKLFSLISECELGYIKIDYNETIGIGCDGVDSPGEELRKHLREVQLFYKRIKEKFPDLIIESCSSGGHRLEPSFINLTDVSSFSDAHETKAIPIIAANLQRQLPPSKNLIWAVIHPSDDENRLYYSLSSLFLGRLCLSGEIDELPEETMRLIRKAVDFHHFVSPLISKGKSLRFGAEAGSYSAPRGWQAILRRSEDFSSILIVLHTFAGSPKEITIPVPGSGVYRLQSRLSPESIVFKQSGDSVVIENISDFSAGVFYLEKK